MGEIASTEVGSSGQQPQMYASVIGPCYWLAIYGHKMDQTSGQISRFLSTKGSDISQFRYPFLSAYRSDIYQSRMGSSLNCVRKLLCNLWTLKACRINISRVPSLLTWHSTTFKYDSSWSLDGLNLQIWPQEPAGRTLLAWKLYNAHLDAYPAGLPTQKRPISVIITPTKGLASNIVHFLPFSHVAHSLLFRILNCQNWMS